MTQQKDCLKICLVGESLSVGGAEKAMAVLSQFFDSNGIKVHLVVVLDNVNYKYSGELLNLGKLKNTTNDPVNKLKRFLKLRKYLRENTFDYIVDFRIRVSFLQEYAIAKWLYNAPTVYTVHSSMLDLYLPQNRWQARAVYKKAHKIVAVSNAIEQMIHEKYGLTNTAIIHNPIDIETIANLGEAFLPNDGQFILAAGRMKDDVKQFGRLIEAYAKTSLPEKNIKLVILGDGPDRNALEKQTSEMNLNHLVIFKGHVENPYPYMMNALFFVLSSRQEGLPTVILESLSTGTPAVAFDCVSGPSEMIMDGVNGLLVEDQNFEKLSKAMDAMAFDGELYQRCKSGAKATVDAFSVENIGRQWLALLKIK